MSVKKNISNNVFRGQEYSDSHISLYTLSIRILESAPPIPLVLTLIALGLLRQRTKHTRFLMDENVAFLQYFRNSFLRLNTRPEEFRKASGFLRIMPQHPGLQYISREYDSRLLLYLDEGGELSPPGAQN